MAQPARPIPDVSDSPPVDPAPDVDRAYHLHRARRRARIEHRRERRHAAFPQCTAEDDAVPSIYRNERRGAQIRDNPPADRGLAMADAAKATEQRFSCRYRRRLGYVWRWGEQRRLRRERRQRGFAAKLKHEHTADNARVAGLVRSLSLHERIRTTPT